MPPPRTLDQLKSGNYKVIESEKSLSAAVIKARELLNENIITSKNLFTEGNKLVVAFYKPGKQENTVYAIF